MRTGWASVRGAFICGQDEGHHLAADLDRGVDGSDALLELRLPSPMSPFPIARVFVLLLLSGSEMTVAQYLPT